MTKIYTLLLSLFFSFPLWGQINVADSLGVLLAKEKIDTNRVKLLWLQASHIRGYDPMEALGLAQQALSLAKKIKYTEGESRSLGVIANTFLDIGNYPQALEYNLRKLQLEEKGENKRNLSSVLMSIGVVYVLEGEYQKALPYYRKSDSMITQFNVEPLKYNIKLNIGDVFDRLNIYDSAYYYFTRALAISTEQKDIGNIGASMTGLGHYFRKTGKFDSALFNYRLGIRYLEVGNDNNNLGEATLGLAKLFQNHHQIDSAVWYANMSNRISERGNFLINQLEASRFMKNLYKEERKMDSAFAYSSKVQELNDSLNSKSRIREIQIISSNEQLRQLQIEEEKRQAAMERSQQLQYLFIGLIIPGLLLITLLLSRIKFPVRVIRILGILSLLILFEFLTLLLHPTVQHLTGHNPIFEILIFVCIAAILIPAHHRIEHWLIEKLIHTRENAVAHKQVHSPANPRK